MNKNICHCELFEGEYQAVFFMFRDEFLISLLKEYQNELHLSSDNLKENPIFQLIDDSLTNIQHFDKVYLDCLPLIPAGKAVDMLTPLFNLLLMETSDRQAGFSFYIKGTFFRLFQILSSPTYTV